MAGLWLDAGVPNAVNGLRFSCHNGVSCGIVPPANVAMSRCRVRILYSGQVQGVGFRYTAKSAAAGFEVIGVVRNLPEGQVELLAEGTREELEGFRQAIREAGLEHFIRNEDVCWSEAQGSFRGFEIVR